MKQLRKWISITMISVAVALTVTSCAGLSSLSDEDAYNFGYGIGRVAGYYLNN